MACEAVLDTAFFWKPDRSWQTSLGANLSCADRSTLMVLFANANSIGLGFGNV